MHTLSGKQLNMLRSVVGVVCDQIVWDINAVYFVFAGGATKVGAVAAAPLKHDPTEEVMHLSVERVQPAPTFVVHAEEGFWYRVLGSGLRVEHIELVRTAVILPGETITAPATAPSSAFIADCGVLVHTAAGILPAVQMDASYGFHNWSREQPRWHSKEEVLGQLGEAYEFVAVAAN